MIFIMPEEYIYMVLEIKAEKPHRLTLLHIRWGIVNKNILNEFNEHYRPAVQQERRLLCCDDSSS